MLTIEILRSIPNEGGLTLKAGRIVSYKSGWQVATEGVEVTTLEAVMEAVEAFGGTCGLWLSNGVWYVDHSHRVATKREALEIGRRCNQQSVLKWATMSLVYC